MISDMAIVDYKEYFAEEIHSRRILIASDKGVEKALERRYEKSEPGMMRNIECMSIDEIAEAIYFYCQAEGGYEEQYQRLDNDEAMMLLRTTVLENIGELEYFTDENLMTIATARELFSKVNLIRGNGWDADAADKDNRRLADLRKIVDKYENVLDKNRFLDKISVCRYAIEAITRCNNSAEVVTSVFDAEIDYIYEDIECYSGIQTRLLGLVTGENGRAVKSCEDIKDVSKLSNCRGKVEFFRGYGAFNEAAFVANDILRKGAGFGQVTVMYSNDAQLPAITAALRGNGIPMRIVSMHPAHEKEYINYVRRILEWAGDKYSEKALERVFDCGVAIAHFIDEDGKTRNALAGQRYFNYVLDAKNRWEDSVSLGWGYSRNRMFIENEKKLPATENNDRTEAVIRMHEKMLDIFSENGVEYSESNMVRPLTVYVKLVDFVSKFGPSNEDYYAEIRQLRNLEGVIGAENRELPLSKVIAFIDEIVLSIATAEAESYGAVTVKKIGSRELLEREYVYMTGLSLKDMQGNTTESPVLFDEEIVKLVGDGYKPTVEAGIILKNKNLYRTVGSFGGKCLILGYSSYDTTAFLENNPSAFFRDMLAAEGREAECIPEFIYGNPGGEVIFNKLKGNAKELASVKYNTSPSALESLLDCPKNYMYDKILKIPDNSFCEISYQKWLEPAPRGSFFHEIAEKYVNDRLRVSTADRYEETADREYIEKLAAEIKERMLEQNPVEVAELADIETAEITEAAVNYFTKVFGEMNESGWRMIIGEQNFDELKFSIEDYNNKSHQFVLKGYIDRIDYLLDKSEQVVHISVSDYKTGSMVNKQNAMKRGELMQCTLYEDAIMRGILNGRPLKDIVLQKIAENENNKGLLTWDVKYDRFVYEFPMDIRISSFEVPAEESHNGVNLTRLKAILTLIDNMKKYPNHYDLYDGVGGLKNTVKNGGEELGKLYISMSEKKGDEIFETVSANEVHSCTYCRYASLCNR